MNVTEIESNAIKWEINTECDFIHKNTRPTFEQKLISSDFIPNQMTMKHLVDEKYGYNLFIYYIYYFEYGMEHKHRS